MSQAGVESLLTALGWVYSIGDPDALQLVFEGEGSQPDRVVMLIIERSRDGRPWGLSFHHPVGLVVGPTALARMESLLRSANDFNASRMFGKVVLSPSVDGSWAIRYMHTFDLSGGITRSCLADPLMLMIGELEGLYDRFFSPAPP
ncbi:MAG: YbjN domain-containing protein [Candidatus Eisenbacteria bacterium]|nr:YbjN domain-containing protein [Candidatus Eisenbacteria bacterium]